MEGPRDVNNPERVPPILSVIDQPQAGLPRVIHPVVSMLVGRPDPALTTQGVISAMSDNTYEIPEDATYTNDAGDPIQFRKGDRVSAATAARFPDLVGKVDGDPNAALARPQAERDANQKADEEAGLVERRMVKGAPENRMEPAPENRSRLARGNEGTATAPDDAAAKASGKKGA